MKNNRYLQMCLSLFLVSTACNQVTFASEPTVCNPTAIFVPIPIQKALKGAVEKTKKKSAKYKQLTVEISNSHQYYVMFTSDDQVS